MWCCMPTPNDTPPHWKNVTCRPKPSARDYHKNFRNIVNSTLDSVVDNIVGSIADTSGSGEVHHVTNLEDQERERGNLLGVVHLRH